MKELLITNGTVVFETGPQKADLLIRGEQIAGLYAPAGGPRGVETLDASGLHIFPGSIDPHTHWGIYNPYEKDVAEDSQRGIVGGLTTVLQFHRHNDDYFETVPDCIRLCDRESSVDYTFSLGLVKKAQGEQLERYIRDLHINSFKFYLDKTNRLEEHYGLTKGTGYLGNKKEVYDLLLRLKALDPNAVLCLHCEDTEVFYPEKERVFASDMDQYALSTYSAARPAFNEVSAILSVLWMNHAARGNIYIVHTSVGDGVKVARRLQPILKGRVTMETCPHYLALDDHAPCGLNATVVPPIRTREDSEELWQGILDGTISTIGTDNCPGTLAAKYKNGRDVAHVIPGFPGAGMILPVLLSEGYHRRGVPLERIAQVTAGNAARVFGLTSKGRIQVGMDADLALVDLDWERTIGPELYGSSDYSIYDGMTLRGWPRYTLLRGTVMQENGRIVHEPVGRFLPR